MSEIVSQERFFQDVDQHQMTIVRDDGVHRHIIFAQPGSWNMRFELVTWPGYLCYTGDMGAFVFHRLDDMFQFFRDGRDDAQLHINLQYWAEKLEAADRCGGFQQWSPEKFRAVIESYLEESVLEGGPSPALRTAIEEEVLSRIDGGVYGEHEAYQAANSFEHDGFRFDDLWDHNFKEYSYRFIWCCYALVWAIQQYDQAPKPKVEPKEVTA